MSTAVARTGPRQLPVINQRCSLRRNVVVQPYGRCSVCTLELKQCHAWQSSLLSFALVVLILVPLIAPELWVLRLSVAAALVALIVQGMTNHKRTDQLIFGQHELSQASKQLRAANDALEQARQGLEREVAARTASLHESNVELARANLELSALAERREQMVLEVSHDLRTPLTSVKGAAQNLLDGIAGPLSESQREYVEITRDHAERLIDAVSRLLREAREQRAEVSLELAPVELLSLARDVTRSLEPIARERGLGLEVKGTAAEALVDAPKLRKVLENLLGNAVKFTSRGGTVAVDVAPSETEIRIAVSDTGSGIAPGELARVFDRFYRGRGEERGTGLGLAITRDLVRVQGGDVLASSTLGAGSTFCVCLPRRAA